MAYETVAYSKDNRIAKVSFCRPKVHNAFNSTVIAEMADVFRRIAADDEIRVVVITGEGKSFCAGADLNWMRGVISQSFEENLAESNDLADLFWQIYTCKRPVIGKINGAAIGGGTGVLGIFRRAWASCWRCGRAWDSSTAWRWRRACSAACCSACFFSSLLPSHLAALAMITTAARTSS